MGFPWALTEHPADLLILTVLSWGRQGHLRACLGGCSQAAGRCRPQRP